MNNSYLWVSKLQEIILKGSKNKNFLMHATGMQDVALWWIRTSSLAHYYLYQFPLAQSPPITLNFIFLDLWLLTFMAGNDGRCTLPYWEGISQKRQDPSSSWDLSHQILVHKRYALGLSLLLWEKLHRPKPHFLVSFCSFLSATSDKNYMPKTFLPNGR